MQENYGMSIGSLRVYAQSARWDSISFLCEIFKCVWKPWCQYEKKSNPVPTFWFIVFPSRETAEADKRAIQKARYIASPNKEEV